MGVFSGGCMMLCRIGILSVSRERLEGQGGVQDWKSGWIRQGEMWTL